MASMDCEFDVLYLAGGVEQQSPGFMLPASVRVHRIDALQFGGETLRGYARFKEVIYRHLHGLSGFPYLTISDVPGYAEFSRISEEFASRIFHLRKERAIDVIHFHDYQVIEAIESAGATSSILSLHAPLLGCLSPVVAGWLTGCGGSVDVVTVSATAYVKAAEEMFCGSIVEVLPPVAGYDLASSIRAEALAPYCDEQVVLCVQRFDEKSGHEQLLRAVAEVRRIVPEMRLVLVGGPTFTDSISTERIHVARKIQELVRTLALNEMTTWHGHIDYAQLSNFYLRSAVVCHLSKMECFGLAVTEAMAHCRPVVATRVGGLADQVRADDSGVLVSVGDIDGTALALSRLLKSSEKRERMGRAAARRYRSLFAPEVLLPRYHGLYCS